MKTFSFFTLLTFSISIQAQELARRAFLGIQMEKLTDDTRRIMKLTTSNGVLITKVFPNSSAEKAKLQVSDVLLSLNGKQVGSTEEVLKLMGTYKGGDEFTYEIIRGSKS